MSNKQIYLILLTLVLLGSFLRFYKIGGTAFDRDEFFELNSSYGYHKIGEWLAWDFGGNEAFNMDFQDDTSNERAEIFRMQLAQFYHFAEPSEALTRGLGAVWGVLGVILVYFVSVSMTGNKYIGLIAAFLTAIGYTEVFYSRRLRMYAMLFPAYLFFSWTVFKFYESKYKGKISIFHNIYKKIGFNPSYFFIAIIAGLVSYNTHMLSVHIVLTVAGYSFLMLLPIIYGLFTKKYSYKSILFNKYFLTVLAGLSAPVVYSLSFFNSLHVTVKKNFRFILSNPNYDFFNQYFSDFAYVGIGVLLVAAGVWFLAAKANRKKEALFIFLSMAVPLAFAVFTWRRDVSHRYIYFIHPFVIILSASGVYGLLNIISEKIKDIKYKAVLMFSILILLILSLNLNYITSKNSDVYVQSSYYPDFKPVFDYVMKNKKEGDVMITRAYRSFYWKGDDIKVYDTKSLIRGKGGCEYRIEEIIKNNPSGWVVQPKVDNLIVCSAGRKYYKENMTRIKDDAFPSSVEVYRWGK